MTSVRYRVKLEDGVWVVYEMTAIFMAGDWKGFEFKLKPTFMTKVKAEAYAEELRIKRLKRGAR